MYVLGDHQGLLNCHESKPPVPCVLKHDKCEIHKSEPGTDFEEYDSTLEEELIKQLQGAETIEDIEIEIKFNEESI